MPQACAILPSRLSAPHQTVAEMRQRIRQTLDYAPWVVCEHRGEVQGYAYASAHRTRAAYQWSVDVSVYVHAAAHRAGVGRAVYCSLFQLLTLQGFYNAYAGITLPNPASVGLHESLGFHPVGVYRAVGYKLGAWHDVGWWQLVLQAHAIPPEPPTDFNVVRASVTWDTALAVRSIFTTVVMARGISGGVRVGRRSPRSFGIFIA